MADLAKVEKPIAARRRGSDNRDFTLPSRRETDTARLEVNAPITGRNQSEAQRLAEILGVAEDAAQAGLGLIEQRDARIRDQDRTAGSTADATGSPDEDRLAKSRAYAQGYYTAGATRTVLELRSKALEAVNERLFNEDDPATLDDVNETLNGLFSSYALNEDGTPRNFGDPAAARIMADGLSKIRGELLPQAAEFIRKQQNEKLASNVAFNLVNGGLPEVYTPGSSLIGMRVPQPGDVQTIDVPASSAEGAPALAPAPATSAGLMAPFAGFQKATPTSRIGAPRSGGRAHNGEDFAVPTGTALVAPAAGRVVSTTPSKAGGKQVIIELENGDRIGFAHLSAVNVKPGDQVGPGQAVALSGNTGQSTGPHVHMTVTVGGKKVSPSEYFAGSGEARLAEVTQAAAGANEDPNLRDRLSRPEAPTPPPVVNFEKVMAQRPPSISPAEWKAYMVPAVIEHAEIAGTPELLEGLWRSTRSDGTPSFNPTEINTIRDAAERIRNERRQEADRVRRETWEKNGDTIIGEILNGRDPSDATLIDMANRGELDNSFVYSIIEHREAEARAAQNEAEADFRQAQAEADREFDLEAATLQMERAAGLSTDSAYAADLRRLQSGELGTGKGAMRRFRQIRAAAAEGRRRIEESPSGQQYATLMEETFPKVSTRQSGSLIDRAMGPKSNVNRTAAFSHYVSQLEAGKTPREAYESAVSLYGKNKGGNDASLRARQAELRNRQ